MASTPEVLYTPVRSSEPIPSLASRMMSASTSTLGKVFLMYSRAALSAVGLQGSSFMRLFCMTSVVARPTKRM